LALIVLVPEDLTDLCPRSLAELIYEGTSNTRIVSASSRSGSSR
jgi:hypothetical protein